MIYVTSDTHFWHDNIIRYCSRPFKTVEEMNLTLIDNWNSVVNKDDTVLHLGDFALRCNNEMLHKIISSLNGKIYLLPGNHDHPERLSRQGIIVITADFGDVNLYIDNMIFSHRPLYDEQIPFGFVNINGHIHNKKSYGRRINVSVDVTNFTPVSLEQIKQKVEVMVHG